MVGEESSNWLRVNVSNMNPMSILNIIDDATMIRMFGRDRFLYLKFLKYQSWFFLCIFALGWTILMPTYNTGKDAEKYIDTVLAAESGLVASSEVTETEEASVGADATLETTTSFDDINLLKFTLLNITSD